MAVESVVRQGCESGRSSGTGTLRGPGRIGPLAVLALLPVCAACASDETPPTAGETLPDGVDTAVRGMRTFITRDGIRRAVVEADTAEWHEENRIHLRRMMLTFFDPSGLESTEVTAEFGIFHELTGDLEAERNVVMEDRRDDQRLETERLRYRNLDGRLYGDTVFQLLRGLEGLTVEGTGFESDPTLDSVVVLNQAGEMRPRVVYAGAASVAADSAGAAGDSTEVVAETAAEESGADPPVADEPASGDSTVADADPGIMPVQDSAAAVDSPGVTGDSVSALPDSLPVTRDSAVAPPDTTTAVPDSTTVVPDSAMVVPDSTKAVPDSTAAPPDTTAVGRR